MTEEQKTFLMYQFQGFKFEFINDYLKITDEKSYPYIIEFKLELPPHSSNGIFIITKEFQGYIK